MSLEFVVFRRNGSLDAEQAEAVQSLTENDLLNNID